MAARYSRSPDICQKNLAKKYAHRIDAFRYLDKLHQFFCNSANPVDGSLDELGGAP